MVRSSCYEDNGVKKGPWTAEEDQKLIDYINEYGQGSWKSLPVGAGLNRCGKSCRLRWTNYLRPDIRRGNFSEDEEHTIIHLHQLLGNKWSRIASHLPGRTDNEIKNFWNTRLRRKLLKKGLDPKTHKPLMHDINYLINNLSQISSSSASNIGSRLMNNPLENALRLQATKIQLFQNLLQLINNNPLSNIGQTNNLLESNNIPAQFVGLASGANSTNNCMLNPSQTSTSQQRPPQSDFHTMMNPSAYTESEFCPAEILNTAEYRLPALVSVNPETSTEYSLISNDSEYWKKLLDDVQDSGPVWNDFME